jgi:[ribosomal protein S5]-alanine N-acetyltransferase
MPPVLETERLILRPYNEADIETAFALFEQDPEVYRFDPGFARTLDRCAAIIKRLIADNEEDGEGTLAVTLKQDGRFIGQAGLQLYVMPWQPFATPEVELRYKFGSAHWGNGYAYEAARTLADFAFKRMRLLRLVTLTHPNNARSVRLLERLGFCLGPAPVPWKPQSIAILTNPVAGVPETA